MYNKKQLKSGPHTGGKTNSNKNDVPYMPSASSYNTPLQRQYTPQEIKAFQGQQNTDSDFENVLEILDPTGISSWDDVYRSYKQSGMDPNTYLELLGAVPLAGKFGKGAKALKGLAKTSRQTKSLNNFANAAIATGVTGKLSDTQQAYEQYEQKKRGGAFGGKQLRLDKRPKTSKNLQSSLNEILMRRNETLFGPSGRRWYKPFDGGGELTPEEEYFQYLQNLDAEKQRVEQTRSNVALTGEKALGLKDQANILKTKLTPINGQTPYYCSTRSCEIEREAGVTTAEDVMLNKKLYPKGSRMPIVPGTEQWESNAKKFGYEKIDPKEKQPGDRVFAMSQGKSFHSLIAGPEDKYFNDHGSGDRYGLDYSFWTPGRSNTRTPAQNVYRYVGNVPQYEEQLAQVRKKITPSTLPIKSTSLYNQQEQELNINPMAKSKRGGETPEAFPQQPTGNQLFKMSFIPQGPVGFYEHGGQLNTNRIAFPQQPPANVFFSNGIPWQPHYGMGGAPCYNCGGSKMNYGGDPYADQFGGNVDGSMNYFEEGGNWIQNATQGMRTDKPCTGSKFGGPECPPGSPRYNLAKTFRAMSKKAKGGPTDTTSQKGYLENLNGYVKSHIGNNLAPFLEQSAADQIASMEQNAQANAMQYGEMGMQTGVNPRMQMYGAEMDRLNNSAQEGFSAFGSGVNNMINTANPYMDYSVDEVRMGGTPRLRRAKDGYALAQERMMGDFPQIGQRTTPNIVGNKGQGNLPAGNSMWNNPNQGYSDGWNRNGPQMSPQQQAQIAAYMQQMQGQGNQNRNMAPNQQAYYNQGMQGNQYIPYNSNPYMSYRTRGTPNMGFNPMNTQLESLDIKNRWFGPGPRRVKATFRTYRDPATGQVTQQPGQGQQGDSQWTPDERAAMAEDAAREQKWGAKPYQPETHNEPVDIYDNASRRGKRKIDKAQERMKNADIDREERRNNRNAEHGSITPYGASPFSAGFPANSNMPDPTSAQRTSIPKKDTPIYRPSQTGMQNSLDMDSMYRNSQRPLDGVVRPGMQNKFDMENMYRNTQKPLNAGMMYGGPSFGPGGAYGKGVPGMPQMNAITTPNMYNTFNPGNQQFSNPNTQQDFAYDQPEGEFQDWSVTGRRRLGLDPTATAEGIMGIEQGIIGLANAGQAQKMKAKMQEASGSAFQFPTAKANRINSKGRWVGTGMGTGIMDPNNQQVTQQPGNNFASEGETSFTRFGGARYEMGGAQDGYEEYLDEDQIQQILANGGQITFLD